MPKLYPEEFRRDVVNVARTREAPLEHMETHWRQP